MDSTILAAIGVVVLIHFIFTHYIDVTKDVNELYLNEQSTIETTALENQSPIYKSCKLDYNGLRVGLDIRYDHYKLRNGNFCDIWEIAMKAWNKDNNKSLKLNGEKVNYGVLNYNIHEVIKYLNENEIKSVGIKINGFLKSVENLTVVLACLVNATLINFYDVDADVDVLAEDIPVSLKTSVLEAFTNEYDFEKDKGIRLRISESGSKIISHTDYVAINFISSVAAAIKHLPLTEKFTSKDKFLIVNNMTVTNVLSKVLVGLVTNADITIVQDKSLKDLLTYQSSVIFTSSDVVDDEVIDSLVYSSSVLDKLKYQTLKYFLSKGKFSKLKNSPLRLLYLSKSINKDNQLSTSSLNRLRSILNARVIVENTVKSIVGPVILSDFYDYRILSSKLEANLTGNGCICQSNEVKLANLSTTNYGDIMIRGYNVGKVNNYLIGKGSIETKANKDDEGFLTLTNVKGKWGSDGCLYVCK
ncbi:hypothetical protein CLIB1444_07S02124 [[Candida] jaroonii]|uniref:Uncharacterized protein n=1 Tax=[Candida] jaroonii TaxID=467808 RepID=A0ACA9YAC3_9ASCO|nr:hypothetical protein CLIB1444_07S02124 [[Candida] jaroonii]